MRRALLSVTDKTEVTSFARGLVELGFELVSTGGTAKALRESGLSVLDVADVTGFPEILDGRVKTLHPSIHGGLLGDRSNSGHVATMQEHELVGFEVLCVNLYAFEATVTQDHTLAEAIESIDIGGPAMIRAGSKNYSNVLVVTDPSDYPAVLIALKAKSPDLNRKLAAKAFRHTAYYDSMVARYLSGDFLDETLTIGLKKKADLRYGENPHQQAALYLDPIGPKGLANFVQLWGSGLSYNNILDGDSAWELVADLLEGSCAIIKHGNPCGVAHGSDQGDSYRLARECDPISAFGGIAAFHGEVGESAALAMTEKGNFLEVVIGTSFSSEARHLFEARSGWGQNVRLLEAPLPASTSSLVLRAVRGGYLVQEQDEEPQSDWQSVTEKKPSAEMLTALRLQWTIAKHVKSNAIVVGVGNRMLGVGAGQMNRVQSVRLALDQAGTKSEGAVLASDAFFPFPDSIETAAKAGIVAVVQPGGSKKDSEVIAAANDLGICMVFSGVRHFRH